MGRITLICGGSGSGKSEFAEKYALQSGRDCDKYYIATMTAGDDEALERIRKHRDRRGTTFITVEKGRDVGTLFAGAEGESVCLLECLGNLTANEMFCESVKSAEEVADKIIGDLRLLSGRTGHLMVVSNDIFSDEHAQGGEKELAGYIRALGMINRQLAGLGDEVIEVVFGKCIYHKGENTEKTMKLSADRTEKKEHSGITLVVGGAYQGKRDFAVNSLGAAGYKLYDGVLPEPEDSDTGLSSEDGKRGIIIDHPDRYVLEHMEDEEKLFEDFITAAENAECCILIADEIGCGIVPADEGQRRLRDVYGRLLTRLAKEADRVFRVYCGIGERIG